MKKAKNLPTEETKVKAAEKVPSEKKRAKDTADGELNFKKVLYGFDPEEVGSYIDELSKTYSAAARNHEERLSSIKEELMLTVRERDSYGEKYRKCKAKLDAVLQEKTAVQPEDKTNEYKEVILKLKERLEAAERENTQLRRAENCSEGGNAEALEAKIAKLEKEKRELALNAQQISRKNEELLAAVQKQEGLCSDYSALLEQIEIMKSAVAEKENELKSANEKLKEKETQLTELSALNENFKKNHAELEVKNRVISQQVEEKENEIQRLKEQNKTQAYEYADKVNKLESEHAKSRLALQKELKLHDYYIAQAEITLSELTKQMEQIKQSFGDAKSV